MGTSGMHRWRSDGTVAAASTGASSKMFVASMAVLIMLSDTTTTSSADTPAPSAFVATCSNGVPGVENGMGTVCCPILCGDTCGGSTCGEVDATNCCASSIVEMNVDCDVSEESPCVISDSGSTTATCSNGVTGVENEMGTVCCPIECGDFCGGEECVINALLCCSSSIIDSDVYCDESDEAPCIIGSASDTPSPVAVLLPTPDTTTAPGEATAPPSNSSIGWGTDPVTVPPTTTPAEVSSEEDDYTPQTLSIVGAAVCAALASAVFVLACVGLKSHCAAEGKSIRRSLEVLCGKGSFWSAMFVLVGLLIALNVVSLGWMWGAVSVYASVVLIFVVVAWFVAFKTGTPATVSLQCACCICPYKPSSFSVKNEQTCPHREDSVSRIDAGEEAPAWEEERGAASSASSDSSF